MYSQACLPTFETIGDLASIAYIRYRRAKTRLDQEGLQSNDRQSIFDDLRASFEISLKLQDPSAIAYQGWLLGQVMAAGGLREDAVEVLEIAASAFEQLQQPESAGRIREFKNKIEGTHDD